MFRVQNYDIVAATQLQTAHLPIKDKKGAICFFKQRVVSLQGVTFTKTQHIQINERHTLPHEPRRNTGISGYRTGDRCPNTAGAGNDLRHHRDTGRLARSLAHGRTHIALYTGGRETTLPSGSEYRRAHCSGMDAAPSLIGSGRCSFSAKRPCRPETAFVGTQTIEL